MENITPADVAVYPTLAESLDQSQAEETAEWKIYKDEPQPPEIGIVVYRNPENLSLREWLTENTAQDPTKDASNSVFEKVIDIKQTTIARYESIKFVEESVLWQTTAPTVIIKRNSNIYKLFYTNAYSDEDLGSVFNQSLSTFKFLD